MPGRKKRTHRKRLHTVAIVFVSVILAAALILLMLYGLGFFNKEPAEGFLHQSCIEQDRVEDLGFSLQLQGVGRFSGQFLEDGSNTRVSDVMMVQIKNTGDTDLRLARLCLSFPDATAEFEITDLPAGKTVMVLEKNRQSYRDREYLSVKLQDVVMHQENMDVCEDRFSITALPGALNVRNISNEDISGDVYVYYKYISGDTLYGGITFRAKISGGIKSGELRQTGAAHFDPDRSIILCVSMEAPDGT